MGHISETRRAKLAELMREQIHNTDLLHRAAEATRARYAWTPEMVETARRMAAEGASAKAIGRAIGKTGCTVSRNCELHGIALGQARISYEAGAQVLREMYPTMATAAEIRARYNEARGMVMSKAALESHAAVLNLRRPDAYIAQQRSQAAALGREEMVRRSFWNDATDAKLKELRARGLTFRQIGNELGISDNAVLGRAHRLNLMPPAKPKATPKPRASRATGHAEKMRALRLQQARQMQDLIDIGHTLTAARLIVRVGEATAARMRHEGLIHLRTRGQKAPEAPKPKAPKPKATYQTVEDWLSAGNRITRCPAAVVIPTTGVQISEEDREAHEEYAKIKAMEFARHGGNAWKAARAAFFERQRTA